MFLLRHDFLYALAATVSAAMGVVMIHFTLKPRGKRLCLLWIAVAAAYFLTLLGFYQLVTSRYYDYFLFFGWIVFLGLPVLWLYTDGFFSKAFTVVSVVFLTCVTSFLSGSTTVLVAGTVNPEGPEGYIFMLPFVGFKLLYSAITVFLYLRFLKKSVIGVFEATQGKMARYVPVPLVSALGFFFITQIVQKYGLMPNEGFFFVAFYLIVCITFGLMYWLIFSNVNWSSKAMKTSAELSVASNIQKDMLPCIFPAFPDRKEFDIFATMQPAKEVGGDFYDMFLIDKDNLAVVIADVSGKGVPAALFMVIAKTLIKNHAQNGEAVNDVFTNANTQLCENNKEGMFVTAWLGVLNIPTGRFSYVNAGHNPPLLRRKDGEFEYLKGRGGFVLAGMEGVRYRKQEMTLGAGDILYLYTDGVTEATDARNELYGEERLKTVLDGHCAEPLAELLPLVKKDIDAFAGDVPQFDDITMLALKINPAEERS